jgi:hypothetical protein
MDNEHIAFILDHISPRISRMELGEYTNCEGLFDKELWNSVPPSEQSYVFERPVNILVAHRKISLEYAGFTKSQQNQYMKI